MQVYVRCMSCGVLSYVEYAGEEVFCGCGNILLEKNDERVPEDYQPMVNDDINVIGDEVDKMVSKFGMKNMDDMIEMYFIEQDRIHQIELSKKSKPLSSAQIGDLVKYGKLFWDVVAIEDDKKLLLSHEIQHVDFNSKKKLTNDSDQLFHYNWKDTLYRKYLNNMFLINTFTEEEKDLIVDTKSLYNDSEELVDKAFFLSKDEVEKYIPDFEDRKGWCVGITNPFVREWLLRVESDNIEEPYIVDVDGSICILERGYVSDRFRPAVWVRI